MSQIHAKIAQQEYLLTCPDGQEDVLQAAVAQVNDALTQVRNAGQVRSREQAATLVALHTMLELQQLREELTAKAPATRPPIDAAMQQDLAALQAHHTATEAACEALIARINSVLPASSMPSAEPEVPEVRPTADFDVPQLPVLGLEVPTLPDNLCESNPDAALVCDSSPDAALSQPHTITEPESEAEQQAMPAPEVSPP